jgi:hypothetical protein
MDERIRENHFLKDGYLLFIAKFVNFYVERLKSKVNKVSKTDVNYLKSSLFAEDFLQQI